MDCKSCHVGDKRVRHNMDMRGKRRCVLCTAPMRHSLHHGERLPGENKILFATLTVRSYVWIVQNWNLQQSMAMSTERQVQQKHRQNSLRMLNATLSYNTMPNTQKTQTHMKSLTHAHTHAYKKPIIRIHRGDKL